MSILDTLITDRTNAHASRLKLLLSRGWLNLSEDERGEVLYGELIPFLDSNGEQLFDRNGELLYCREGIQRGAYNASDLNRVASAVVYLKNRLSQEAGVYLAADPKQDWSMEDIPTREQMEQYLEEIRAVRGAFAVPEHTPEAPDAMRFLDWSGANSIEQILVDTGDSLERLPLDFLYSGEAAAGEV